MKNIAYVGELILLGLWGATLSSALGAILGAARTLQALAQDKILFRFLSKSSGKNNEPRIATIVTTVVGLSGIIAGDLDIIAPILSMFFLTSYGILNLACAFENLIASPSWRPKFKIPWLLSAIGGVACFLTMLMINAGATIIAITVTIVIYLIVKRRRIKANWGDIRYGVYSMLARFSLYQMDSNKPKEKSWKPNILVLSGSPASRWYLISIADAISHGRGLLSIAVVVQNDSITEERSTQMQVTIREHLKKQAIPALVKMQRAQTPMEGVSELIKTYGFGPLIPNTILMGEAEEKEKHDDFIHILFQIYRSNKNLIMIREGEGTPEKTSGAQIEIWIGNKTNAGFILAISYLLQNSPEWEDSTLVLRRIIDEEGDINASTSELSELIQSFRINAVVSVSKLSGDDDIFEHILKTSRKADIIFLGMRPPSEDESIDSYKSYYSNLLEKTKYFPLTAFCLASENIDFNEIFK